MVGSRRVAVLLAVSALVLCACSSRVGGRPVAATTISEEPAERTAESVLGELTTVDPCSLTDPAVFSTFGTAEFAVPESLDYCTISVKPATDVEIVLRIGELGELSESPELAANRVRELDGGTYVAQRDAATDFCSQALVFVDEITLEVASSAYRGTLPDTCDMVTAAMDDVVRVTGDGRVEHRSPADGSLLGIDPCSLVDDVEVTALPGFAAAQRREYPGRHQCSWQTSTGPDRLSLRVVFGAGPAPTPVGTGAENTSIAGRPSVTTPYPDGGTAAFCGVESGQLAFDEVPGQDGMVEIASVYARVPKGQVDQGCQAAVALATAVWAKLPTP